MTTVEVCSGVAIPVLGCVDALGAIIMVALLAIGGFIALRSLWAWIQSLLLRAAFHHVLFGAIGAAGVGVEMFTDMGVGGLAMSVLDWVIGVAF